MGSIALARNRILLTQDSLILLPSAALGLQAWYDASRLQIGAAQFTASVSQYLSVDDHADLNLDTSDHSWVVWFRLDSLGTKRDLVSKFGNATTVYELYVAADNTVQWEAIHGGVTRELVQGTTVVAANIWYQAVVVVDRDNAANTKVYINGVDDTLGTPTVWTDAISNFSAVNIGRSGSGGLLWAGRIAKVGFWKKVLSVAEVASLYNSGAGLYHSQLSGSLLTSLISYWNLNENGGQRNDSTANAHHLTDNNTVSCAPSMTPETPADATLVYIAEDASGNGNHATQATEGSKPAYKIAIVNGKPVMRFDGTDDFVSRAAFDLGLPITGIVVIRHSNITPDTQIMGWGGVTRHTVITDSQNFRVCLGGSCGVAATTPFQNNVTTIRAYTIDALGAINYYINGAADGTASAVLADISGSGTLYLGTLTGVSQFLPGDLAEVIIYNRVLSATEIARLTRYLGRKYGIALS